ncbi:PEP-CTERM sorting domain-containing protein [Candidatus Uabimicrobium amorphum]|uniref:PEP-CTERM protein-sorting domain-containing protein n=1 Tax=Uabimicrobium amorphum TaxID=2596890 RepID=A0A5S9IRZ5_UABAM|nr:PEP-CTERM sorting domain-containing protein [Candidatus Uabimicrobium amorphum]BBM87019.1 hypothetical protein UABAM_05421 [Candidatus Uabimicrobium amorphum]
MTKYLLIVICAISLPISAATITADATGPETSNAIDFWGVSFDSGSGFVQSITWDVSSFPNFFFDFDPAFTGAGNFGPEPLLSNLVGLQSSDITFSFTGVAPTVITANFAAGSFEAGDSFRFDADIDFGATSGDLFAGLAFSVTLENGNSDSGTFAVTGAQSSGVTVNPASNVIPEPSTYIAMLFGIFALLGLRRK